MFYRAINFKLWDIFSSEKKLLSPLLDKKKLQLINLLQVKQLYRIGALVKSKQ